MLNVCEGLVLALGRFLSYEAGVFFMLTRKVIRYSVQKALKLVLILVFSRHSIILIATEIFFFCKNIDWSQRLLGCYNIVFKTIDLRTK